MKIAYLTLAILALLAFAISTFVAPVPGMPLLGWLLLAGAVILRWRHSMQLKNRETPSL